jgi:flavin-dependent dehydrogenase
MAALVLARGGKKVLLLDRSAFPRAKVCGDCINPSSDPIWQRLGLMDSYQTLPHHVVTGLTLEREGAQLLRHTFGGRTQGSRVVARSILDSWLLEQAREAGATIMLETIAESIDAATGFVRTNRGDFTGETLLGADGRTSFAAKQAGLSPAPRRCRRIAWQTTLTLGVDLPEDELDSHVHLRIFPEGYYGLVRINEAEANLCFVLDCQTVDHAKPIAERYFPRIGERTWRKVNPITRGPAQLGKARLWLVGDAARVVEPFTGEGIYFALASGELAAKTLLAGKGLAEYARKHPALYRRRAWINDLVRLALLKPKRALFFTGLLRHTPSLLTFMSERIHARK